MVNAKDNVADVVKRLKGGMSRVILKEFPELEEFLWGIVSGRMAILQRY